MTVDVLAPAGAAQDFPAFLAGLAATPCLEPFSGEALAFTAGLSESLRGCPATRPYPELQALGFWFRRSHVRALQQEFESGGGAHLRRVPRGTAFHVAPANVETLFVYSWLISLLCGNRNVLRISARASEITDTLCRVIAQHLDGCASLARANVLIRYAHSEEVTATLSRCCDLRVIWGGDDTVAKLRGTPLPPHAVELVFPDRYSLAAIRAAAFLEAGEAGRARAVRRFYTDCYWFDQAACSSPRLLVWCGPPDACEQASDLFYTLLAAEIARRGYRAEPGARLRKLLFSSRMIVDGRAHACHTHGSELTVLELAALGELTREHCGAGLLFAARVEDLADLARHLSRRDQTLTHFGFEAEELRRFAGALNGHGLDRMVPFGQALVFNRYWDGFDLFEQMTRRVWIE